MRARIYKPSKTAMQSGRGRTRNWVLEFEPEPKFRDHLMGWTGSLDTRAQVRLRFPTQAEAIAYAKKHGLEYEVAEPHGRTVKPKSYADNFRWNRIT